MVRQAKLSTMLYLRVEELRYEIKKGLDSGESTPLDVEAIKARGRRRLDEQQNKSSN